MSYRNKFNRFLFGYDFFLSYSRRDCSEYTASLANKIIQAGYTCYIDQWGSDPGKELPKRLKHKIRSSSVFILIASETALNSDAISQEIDLFLATKRVIIPVDFGKIYDASWFSKIEGIAISTESQNNIKSKAPSDELLERAINSFTYTKQSSRIRYSGLAAIGLIVFSIIISLFVTNALNNKITTVEKKVVVKEKELLSTAALLEKSQDSIAQNKKELLIQKDSLNTTKEKIIKAQLSIEKAKKDVQLYTKLATENYENAGSSFITMRDFIRGNYKQPTCDTLNGQSVDRPFVLFFNDFTISNNFNESNELSDDFFLFLNSIADCLKTLNSNERIKISAHLGWDFHNYALDKKILALNRDKGSNTILTAAYDKKVQLLNSIELPSGKVGSFFSTGVAQAISERAANYINQYLVNNGVDANRIMAMGYGNNFSETFGPLAGDLIEIRVIRD